MAKYLVDTTVFIDHLRGDSLATKLLKEHDVVISVVTAAELVQGTRSKKELRMIERLIDNFEVDWGSERINRLALKLLSERHLEFGMRILDALIAATALINKYILVTDNIKHFKLIAKLEVIKVRKVFS